MITTPAMTIANNTETIAEITPARTELVEDIGPLLVEDIGPILVLVEDISLQSRALASRNEKTKSNILQIHRYNGKNYITNTEVSYHTCH